MNLKPQARAVLDFLITGKTLTVLESIEQLGVYALSQRCGELRKAGLPIDSEMITLKNGKKVALYRYKHDAHEQVSA